MRYSYYTPLAIAALAAACNDALTAPGDIELGVAGATGRLSIRATQSAVGLREHRVEYDWTAQRYVREIHVGGDMRLLPERDRVEILPGQMVWVTFQVDAQRRLASEATVKGVRGNTCVTNTGRSAITGFAIVEQVLAPVNGHLRPIDGATTIVRVDERLEVGVTRCFDYEILFDAQSDVEYRVVAAIAAHVGGFGAALASADFEVPPPSEIRTVEIDAEAWMRDGAFPGCDKTLGPDFTCTSIDGIPRDQRIAPPSPTGHLGMSFLIDIKNEGVCGQTFVYTIDEPLREGGPKPPGGEIREVSGSLVITTGPCPPAGDNCVQTEAWWREHSPLGSGPDEITQWLTIFLGRPDGPKTYWVAPSSDNIAFVLNRGGDPSNGIRELYAQLFLAKLNIARGADPRPIRQTRIAADIFLSTHNQWATLSDRDRSLVLEWTSELQDYNEGRNGPHRCGEDDDDDGDDDGENNDGGARCTRTIGYWKNHAGFGPQPDVVTALLPVWLGLAAGVKSVVVTSAAQAVTLLNKSGDASNGINKLYAQLLGAKLNIESGADGAAVLQTITQADMFLSTHDAASWGSLSATERQQVLTWMTLLDDYNNGKLGPGHCD
jgi:hypothetical protein